LDDSESVGYSWNADAKEKPMPQKGSKKRSNIPFTTCQMKVKTIRVGEELISDMPSAPWTQKDLVIEFLLLPEEVCQILNCGETTLRQLKRDLLLIPKMVRSLPRYRPRDVLAYIERA
jgi:hypothetical protein